MLIAKETALSIVQEMKAAAGCDINLMDDTGRILASTDSALSLIHILLLENFRQREMRWLRRSGGPVPGCPGAD